MKKVGVTTFCAIDKLNGHCGIDIFQINYNDKLNSPNFLSHKSPNTINNSIKYI